MPTFTTTTNVFAPFNYLTNLALIIDIEKAIAGNQCILATGIKRCILDQTPAAFILKEIREMATDNIVTVEDMLGVKLVNRIVNGV